MCLKSPLATNSRILVEEQVMCKGKGVVSNDWLKPMVLIMTPQGIRINDHLQSQGRIEAPQ